MNKSFLHKIIVLFLSVFLGEVVAFADNLELSLTPILNDNAKLMQIKKVANNTSATRHDPNRLGGGIALEKEKASAPIWKKGHEDINLVLGGLLYDLEDGKLNSYIPDFSSEALEQLAAAYLLCTKRQGPCEFMLETLLEIETLKSIKNNDVSCSNLKQFWKIWVDNNYEKMLNYDTKLGLIEKIRDFRANQMARYVKCDNSVRENFKKDYIPSKESIDNMKKTLRLMNLLEKKYGDISAQFVNEK